jgi:hypothetical protein
MNLGQIASKAKQLVDKRGGSDSLKQDADELKDIASGSGSLSDKAKAAAEAIKEPGADETSRPGAAPATAHEQVAASPQSAEPAEERPTRRRAGRRRRR